MVTDTPRQPPKKTGTPRSAARRSQTTSSQTHTKPLRGTAAPRPGTHKNSPTGVPSRSDRFGYFTEWIARSMGTPWFLLALTIFVLLWMGWNTFGPSALRFDSIGFGFVALTLVLSLQASYAAPLILLAQNRQDDRDRVHIEQDRQRAERTLADTEYLAREVAALRLALQDAPSKDFIREELRALIAEVKTHNRGAHNETSS